MLRPLRDKIVVKPIERVKSEVLVVVQDEKPNLGRVVAVGPGKRDKRGRIVPLDVQPGALVRFGTAEGYLTYTEFEEAGERFLVMQEADVCFIAEGEPAEA